VRQDNEETVLFRDHPIPDDAPSGEEPVNCTILEAARATSAAPFYFPTAKVGGIKYFDGGLENNNPIDKVWVERAPVRPNCVLSLGTGMFKASPRKRFVPGFMDKTAKILSNLTNVQDRHKNFARNMAKENIAYFRFDPKLEVKINLDDHAKMHELERMTEEYLGLDNEDTPNEVRENLKACAKKLVEVSDGPVCPY